MVAASRLLAVAELNGSFFNLSKFEGNYSQPSWRLAGGSLAIHSHTSNTRCTLGTVRTPELLSVVVERAGREGPCWVGRVCPLIVDWPFSLVLRY